MIGHDCDSIISFSLTHTHAQKIAGALFIFQPYSDEGVGAVIVVISHPPTTHPHLLKKLNLESMKQFMINFILFFRSVPLLLSSVALSLKLHNQSAIFIYAQY